MQFDIKAILVDGSTVFCATMNYLPRKDEEIEINGFVFTVKKVRYVFEEGLRHGTKVLLLLEQTNSKF
jgi:hypothetical protein